MSSALAIASVTYVLKDLLNNGLIDQNVSDATGGNVNVTTLPPDRIDITSGGQSQLNLYMYRVTFNQGWSNVALPSRDNQGERVSNPPLSLNLHYLLTSYGVNELHTEILLGYGMQLLHEIPVLDRKAISRSLATSSAGSGGGLPDEFRALSTSELAEQIEQIKITPENLNTEEISKLWTAFGSKYRPTAAYLASVVLIESKESTKSALRVRQQNIYVNPFHQPVIEKIKSQMKPGDPIVEDQPIFAGYNLVISGRQLISDNVKLKIGDIEVTPAEKNIADSQILFPLPVGLQAGVQNVQVIHNKMMGSPLVAHHGVESNVAAFVLRPAIIGNPKFKKNKSTINLIVKPAVHEKQRVILLLNELKNIPDDPDPPHSYSFSLSPEKLLNLENPVDNITIPISGVEPGTYLMRIQVDGAESPLETDEKGKYNSPKVAIT